MIKALAIVVLGLFVPAAFLLTPGDARAQGRNTLSALSLHPGTSSSSELVHKFGRNDVISTSWEIVARQGGVYSGFLTSGTQIEVLSSDADDTNTAGAGCRVLRVDGLNSSFVENTETFNMNGISAVTSATSDWIRVFRAFCVISGAYSQGEILDSTGGGGSNEGTITVRVVSAGATLSTIAPGMGESEQTNYTIPEGYTGYLKGYSIHVGAAANESGTFVMYQRRVAADTSSPFVAGRAVITVPSTDASVEKTIVEYSVAFPEKTDIWWIGQRTGSADIDAAISYVIELIPDYFQPGYDRLEGSF